MSMRKTFCFAVTSSLLFTSHAFSQEPQKPADEVIRITTELVQTGVVVVNKQGKFVDGLKPEQFLLKVDGRPVTPAFVEQVIARTIREQELETSAGYGHHRLSRTLDDGIPRKSVYDLFASGIVEQHSNRADDE
jgi:hypothetical protein